jgi:flagellar hook-length control protein FliK
MPIASIAPSPAPSVAAAVAGTSVAGLGAAGPSPFQALLAPALLSTPAATALEPTATIVPATGAETPPPVSPTVPPPDVLTIDDGDAVAASTLADGNSLPGPAAAVLTIPGLAIGTAAAGSALAPPVRTTLPASVARAVVAGARAGVAEPMPEAAAVGIAGEPTVALALDPDLATGNAAGTAYLDRFNSGPHRLPVVPGEDIAVDPDLGAALADVGKGGGLDVADSGNVASVAVPPRPTVAATTAPPVLDAPSPGFRESPGSAQWQRALDDQLLLMVNKGSQHARIRMHPEDMGQLDIRIVVGNDRVDLNFAVQHAAVAAAVHQHLPHLAQLFAEQGLAMGQTSVSQQQADGGSQASGGDGRTPHSGANAWPGQGEEIVSTPGTWTSLNRGLFDAFA